MINKNKNIRITITISIEQDRWLNNQASKLGITKSKLITKLLSNRLEQTYTEEEKAYLIKLAKTPWINED